MNNKSTSFRPQVEGLEDRVVPAKVDTSIRILKPILIEGGVILKFNSPVDFTRATDISNYTLKLKGNRGSRLLKIKRVSIDEATHRVQLTWAKPRWLGQLRKIRIIINGNEPTGLTGVNGQLLDGDRDGQSGGDANLVLKWVSGRRWKFTPAENTLGLTQVKIL